MSSGGSTGVNSAAVNSRYRVIESSDELLVGTREIPRWGAVVLLFILAASWGLLSLAPGPRVFPVVFLSIIGCVFVMLAVTSRWVSVKPGRIEVYTKPLPLWYNRTVSPAAIHTICCTTTSSIVGRGGSRIEQCLVTADIYDSAKAVTIFAFYSKEDAAEFARMLVDRLNRFRAKGIAPVRLLT
jgi:hypothetical protein